ncbi:MAG: glutathione S-transferase family protein [Myxococcales bacterium]|nr:glutathione S-transferase family protein [Myxococcales bacterium]
MPNPPEIVLHQWCISPFCTKVRKTLAYKGLSYRIQEYGGIRALHPKLLSQSGKLPVLDYGSKRVVDSSAIARFLDERHPSPPLLPVSKTERALALLLEDWADESLYWYELWLRVHDEGALDLTVAAACEGLSRFERVAFKRGMLRYRRWLVAQGLGRYPRETVLANFREHLDTLDTRLMLSPWLVGESPSIADIAVAAQLDEVLRTSPLADEIRALPRVGPWLERCSFDHRGALGTER